MHSSLSEKEQRLMLDAIKDHAIFMMDVDGNVISWNDGATRLKGYKEEEIIGKHFRVLFQPEDQEEGRPEWEMNDALEKGKHEEEWWRMRQDGTRFWAHVILQPIFDDNNKHIGFVKITSDITEQKRINDLNDFLMNEVAGYAIFLLDKKGKVTNWSRAAESIIGYTEQEVKGKSLSFLYVPTDGNDIELEVEQHLLKANNDRYEEDGWKVKKDGSDFWANYIITPLHNGDGFVVMIRDLTDKKIYEQEIKANTALTASNIQLEHFASLTSHELKEPVRKISMFCSRLKANAPNQEILIDKILAANRRVVNLLDNILELSLLTHNKPVAKQDLNNIIQNVLMSFAEEIKEKSIVIHYEPLPKAHVVSEQIEQLMQNLIGNALKYSSQNNQKPEVKIKCAVVLKGSLETALLETMVHSNSYLQIRVQDNGIGFEQKHAANIFDLFTRLHGSSEYEGTGVGLSICKRIAENHGGNIKAFSEPGKGALFVVTLPFNNE